MRVALGGDRQSWCWSALLPLLTIISCVQMASSLICVTGAQLGPEPLCLGVMGQPQLQTWPWGFEDGRWETGPSSKGSLSVNEGLQMGPASTWVCSIPGHSLGYLVCFFFFPSSSLSLFWSPGPHQVYSGLKSCVSPGTRWPVAVVPFTLKQKCWAWSDGSVYKGSLLQLSLLVGVRSPEPTC